ncbi:MAG: hypothetical protein HY433_03570 [Candidatus Liptonbacteria bacterium]|nr:hypothetical protein [Candidatus Liptonbacteria bacterium]
MKRNVVGLVALLFGILVGSANCAGYLAGQGMMLGISAVSDSDALLPEQVAIVAPAQEIPADMAAFAGLWQARVGHRFTGDSRGHVLIVERIASPDDVTVVFGIGGIPNIWGHEWGKSRSERVEARFENGKLIVHSGQWVGKYTMSPEGLVADIRHPFAGSEYIYNAALRRTNLAELRKEANAK